MVERPRLLQVLRSRFDVAVTTVVAGAGFGKSVLLAQAIRDNTLSPRGTDLWLSCDTADTLATNLLRGLADAAGIEPDRVPDATSFVVEVAQRWPMGCCLILDDLHLVEVGSPGAMILTELVGDAPPGVSFVLASRTPFAGLARLRAQGRVLALDESDLAYHDDELRQVGSDFGSELGGWPALVSLASTFGVDAARQFVAEELVSTIDPFTRRALAVLALIGGADATLAAQAVGEAIDTSALLALPMVTSDGSHIVPHALWSELLAGELGPDEIGDVHRRVGRALLERGDEIGAGSAFVAAHDTDGLRHALRSACARGYATTPGDVLASWWAALDPADQQTCEALLLDALVKRSADPFSDETRAALTGALAAARRAGDTRLEMAALWEFGFTVRARGEIEAMVAEVPRVLAMDAEGEPLAASLATMARAMVSDAFGDHVAAAQHLRELDRRGVPQGWLAPVEFMRMLYAFYDGDLPGVRDAADAFLQAAPTDFPGRAFIQPWLDWLEGRAPTDWGTVPMPGSFPGSTAADRLWSGSSMGTIFAYANRHEEAEAAVALAEEAAHVALLPHHQAMVAAARAAVNVSRGDEAGARAVLSNVVGTDPNAIGASERAVRFALPLGYVLLPQLRDQWDACDLGPLHAGVRRLARAVLDARDGRAPTIDDPFTLDHLATALPLDWAVEVACAAVADDGVRAREMIEVLARAHGERTRDALRRVAESDGTSARVAKGASRLLASVPVGTVAVEVRVLGPAELVVDGASTEGPDWRRGRVRALLSLLALRRRVRREEAMLALWPDLDGDAARHNLRVTLNYLQRLLEPHRRTGEAPFYLRQDGDWLHLLDEPHVVVDAESFETAIDEADRARSEGRLEDAASAYARAGELWRGGCLPDVANEEWAQPTIARLSSRAVNAKLALASIQLALDDVDGASATAFGAIEIDPWCEPAHRLVVAAHLARGDRPGARQAMRRCQEMLEDLGVAASPETLALERRLADPG